MKTLDGREVQRRHASRRSALRLSLYVVGGVIGVALVAFAAFIVTQWPKAQLHRSAIGLARLETTGISQSVAAVTASEGSFPVHASVDGSIVTPSESIRQGVHVKVSVRLERPSWISWLVGRYASVSLAVKTPRSTPTGPVAVGGMHGSLLLGFSSPIRRLLVVHGATRQFVTLSRPSTAVDLSKFTAGLNAGVVGVAGAPNTWESFAVPRSITFFRVQSSQPAPLAVVNTNLLSLAPSSQISLTLSKPVHEVFGSSLPSITPSIAGANPVTGKWSQTGSYTLQFTPTAPTFWPGESFSLSLPAAISLVNSTTHQVGTASKSLNLQGMAPSVTRLQEMLAALNYLPVSFSPSSTISNAAVTLGNSVTAPLPGSFAWRWAVPSALSSQWSVGQDTPVTKGAIMAFEQFNHLDSIGLANPLLWPTLVHDVASHALDPHRYSWIEVTKTRPEMLQLYENGAVVTSGLVNTGIAGLNTTVGTFPIYLRFPQNYMSGTNPNGTKYHDHVFWINYFLGSEAVHGFVRASYGFPQSLGCVELPVATAQVIYPQVHIGTPVTVLPQGDAAATVPSMPAPTLVTS